MHAVASFWRKAYEDNLTGMAAMVAYNLLLSLFPLALIALFIAGRVLSSRDIETSVVADLQQLFPTEAESTLLDVLLFFGATVAVPTLQGLLVTASEDLPLGLDRVQGLVGGVSLAAGLVLLFMVLCLIY